ncbi:unnamed protein product, partial [marine sediment metagenome]
HKVYAWNGDGSAVSGWPRSTGGNMAAPPALGDLDGDGDGDLEIVIGCGHEGDPYNPAPCTDLYAWHGNGIPVSGFPMSPSPNTGWPADPNGLPYSPVLADYDGDDSVEILVLNRWSWGISTVGSGGQDQPDASLRTGAYTLSSTPHVDDVDGDGKLEVVVGGATSGGANGAVYIWDVNGDADDALPWPMFHQNVARTGRCSLFLRPSLGFPGEIRVFHQYGSGETETGYVSVRNEGEGTFDWSITHAITRLQTIPPSGTVTSIAPVQFVITTTD